MTDEEVAKLQQRVANGIEWLSEHDPDGRFHLWFEAKIRHAGPAQPAEVAAAYAEYVRRRETWERLSDALGKVDPGWRETPVTPGLPHVQWDVGKVYEPRRGAY